MISEIDKLVERAKKGEQKAEAELFDHLTVRFRNFATFRIGADQAEDIAQNAVMIILEKYKNVEFSPNFDAWAHGVFKNVLRNYYRKAKVRDREVNMEDDSNPKMGSTTVPDIEVEITLIKCLEKMMESYPRYTRILKRVYQGYQTGEICEEFRIKPNNFFVILKRGRDILKLCLETGRV